MIRIKIKLNMPIWVHTLSSSSDDKISIGFIGDDKIVFENLRLLDGSGVNCKLSKKITIYVK